MGVTYRAVDSSLRRSVALKIINTDLASRSAEARERFIREARMAAALRHPNVAAVHHFGIREETGQCYCAMELVEGETLEERVRRTGPLDVRSVVEIARQIVDALSAAEKQGLVHRDLKPANVMIAASEVGEKITVKVIDFGVAKALAETPDARVLTHNGFIGTPAFASPEQFTNAPVDTRSDIYSLGATLWYLLTGHMPFGDRALDRSNNNRNSSTPPCEQLKAAHVPSRLSALLLSMLSIEPAARPGVRDLTTRLDLIRAHLADPKKAARRFAIAAGSIALIAIVAFFVFQPFGARVSPSTRNAAERSIAVPLVDVGSIAVPEKSIAVLPFENLSADQVRDEVLGMGMADTLITKLSNSSEIVVTSLTSVRKYGGSGPGSSGSGTRAEGELGVGRHRAEIRRSHQSHGAVNQCGRWIVTLGRHVR